jgi:hypothetical protein
VQQNVTALPLQVVVPKTASEAVRYVSVQKIYQHPAYNKFINHADISLLKVNNSISFSPNTKQNMLFEHITNLCCIYSFEISVYTLNGGVIKHASICTQIMRSVKF